ncbi:MAG: ribokinase [Solirubrobacteraceae bacterium]|jgi:sugar/nucleoside kinase (ribokinase family)|nr:ribokinase [Solirubrobacteraceae bacterium]
MLTSPTHLLATTERQPRAYTVTVLGDVRIDVRSRLATRFADVSTDHFEFAPIALSIAGTAANFARYAVEHFAAVNVLAAVGCDAYSSVVQAHFHDLGVTPLLTQIPDVPNGVVLIVRDAPSAGSSQGTRVLISSQPAPSHFLAPRDVLAYRSQLSASDLLVVDGYSLLTSSSSGAVDTAITVTNDGGGLVCIDLVPHDLDRFITYAELLIIIRRVDVIIVEAATLARLIGHEVDRDVTARTVRQLLDEAGRDLPNSPLWLVRYGIGAMDDVTVYRQSDVYMEYNTGYATADEPTAYGDRVAAAELRWWLDRVDLGSPADASVW